MGSLIVSLSLVVIVELLNSGIEAAVFVALMLTLVCGFRLPWIDSDKSLEVLRLRNTLRLNRFENLMSTDYRQ